MPLPIDPLIPEIVTHLRTHTTLVVEAPAGAGKTTRVPPALLDLSGGDVLVLEPRRLAARLAARYVAAAFGEPPGETVGYQVRFEEVAGPRTRLRFLTEGVLTRRLLIDPRLDRVAAVVLDEFHERHLEGDLALALLRRLREISEVQWNRAAARVEAVSALMFDQIAIQESRAAPDAEAAAALLARKGVEAGLANSEDFDAFLQRIRFAGQYVPLPEISAEAALRVLATGLKSLAELESAVRDGGLSRALELQLTPQSRRLLEQIAPGRIRLPSGRQVRVHYEPNQPPWIASRLQDFFGMRQTPRVGAPSGPGVVPVVVRLLAPNQRPVQMTTDLAGFWQRLYPQLRQELSRRYPKHKWPAAP